MRSLSEDSRMRVAVTGATGVIGRAAVRSLVGAGHDVVGHGPQRRRTPRSFDGLGATTRGDVLDLDGLARLYEGADAVINLATSCRSARAPCPAPGDATTGSARPGWQRRRGGPRGPAYDGWCRRASASVRRPGRRVDHRAQPGRHHADDRAGRRGGVPRAGLLAATPGSGWCSGSARSSATTARPRYWLRAARTAAGSASATPPTGRT